MSASNRLFPFEYTLDEAMIGRQTGYRAFGQQDDEQRVLECRRIGITNCLEAQLTFRRSNIFVLISSTQSQSIIRWTAQAYKVNRVLHSTLQYGDETMIRNPETTLPPRVANSLHSARVLLQTTRYIEAHIAKATQATSVARNLLAAIIDLHLQSME